MPNNVGQPFYMAFVNLTTKVSKYYLSLSGLRNVNLKRLGLLRKNQKQKNLYIFPGQVLYSYVCWQVNKVIRCKQLNCVKRYMQCNHKLLSVWTKPMQIKQWSSVRLKEQSRLHLVSVMYFAGQADPYCCLPGMEFVPSLRQCVDTTSRDCVNQNCPYGFLEGCFFLFFSPNKCILIEYAFSTCSLNDEPKTL